MEEYTNHLYTQAHWYRPGLHKNRSTWGAQRQLLDSVTSGIPRRCGFSELGQAAYFAYGTIGLITTLTL
jgi:hypothetical protein